MRREVEEGGKRRGDGPGADGGRSGSGHGGGGPRVWAGAAAVGIRDGS